MSSVGFFLRFFFWFSLRNLSRHKGRTVIVMLGIALGAAVFGSVRLSIHASLEAFSGSMDRIAGRAQKVLIRPAGRVPEHLVADLLKHPLVKAASPVMTAYVKAADDPHTSFLLIGIDPILDRSFRSWRAESENSRSAGIWRDLMGQPFTFLVGEKLAEFYGWRTDQVIDLVHIRGKIRFKVLDVLTAAGLSLAQGGRVAITDIASFQEFTGIYGQVDRIDVMLKKNAEGRVQSDVEKMLPEGVQMVSPADAKRSGKALIKAYRLNLSILSFVSLFVGMFLVYSLVALNAASRRHELAVMRSTGASARMLFFLFLTEGAFFGLVGWLIALPLASLFMNFMIEGVSRTISTLFVRVQVQQAALSIWEVLLSFAVTLLVSVLAAVQPAREAMQVAPQEALSSLPAHGVKSKRHLQLAAGGTLCIVAVWPLSGLPAWAGYPLPGYLATFLLFSGFSLTAPLLLQMQGRLLSPWLGRMGGIPAYLAGRYVRDSGSRTAISVGALITAVALFTALVVMIYSFRQTVQVWVRQTVSGDVFAAAKLANINRYRDPIPAEIQKNLQAYSQEVDLVAYRRFYTRFRQFPYQFEAIDVKTFMRHGSFVWLSGKSSQTLQDLKKGRGVIVSEVFANGTGLGIGDRFTARIDRSDLDLPILGIIRDYRTQGGVVFFSLSRFAAISGDRRWSGVRFFLRNQAQDPDADAARLQHQISSRWGDRLDLISGSALRRAILKVFDETFAVTTVLLIIALIVAALGITTTLTVLVLERSRQLNTLFAIGASRRQIRIMVIWEALLMVTAGEVAGLACGFLLSYLLVFVINRQSFGWTFFYGVDWPALAMSIPLIVVTALAAALPAMKLVFRQPPATLLRER